MGGSWGSEGGNPIVASRKRWVGTHPTGNLEGKEMSGFGDDLIQSMTEALAHAKGEGPALVHAPIAPREVREQARLTQVQMAPLVGMSLSGYRKWEQRKRNISGPAAALLRLIEWEPEAVKRALVGLTLFQAAFGDCDPVPQIPRNPSVCR